MNCPYLIYDIVYIEENNDEFEIYYVKAEQ